ncbi:MAG: hypothetical protein ABI333_08090 [bacterium]
MLISRILGMTLLAGWTLVPFSDAARAAPPADKPAERIAPVRAPPPPRTDSAPARSEKKPAEGASAKKSAWKKVLRFIEMFHPSTVWYLRYRYGVDDGGETYNNFHVGRGYLTLKFEPTKWFEGRITTDVHQDDEGDWKVRLKYLYGKLTLPVETVVVSEPYVELGMVHMPWLDYEEHINWYRMQGTMFIERNELFNSADLGLTIGVLLGRKLPKAYQKKVGKKYPGTWGSLAFGVYNGGGYHAKEANKNKVLEGRVSVRPLGHIFPNLQLSYFFTYGKGNKRWEPQAVGDPSYEWPDWQTNLFMASFEHQYLVLTGTFAFGRGRQKGAGDVDPAQDDSLWVDAGGNAESFRGASAFLEVRLPWILGSVWGRYDWFDGPFQGVNLAYHRITAAYAFHFWGRNKNVLVFDFEYLLFDDPATAPTQRPNQWAVTLTLQIKLE